MEKGGGSRQAVHSLRALLNQATLANAETMRRIRDDLIVRELEKALHILIGVANQCGTVWLCGSNSGICSAIDVERRLTVRDDRKESPVRAKTLGLNIAAHAARLLEEEQSNALGSELYDSGRRKIDCLWCFAVDAGNELVLNAARVAHERLKIPVIAFTGHPGTPLIRFADAKIQIQAAGEDDHDQRVQEAHTLLYQTLIQQVKQTKRDYK